MTRLPASGAWINTPRRDEGALRKTLGDFGLAKVFDESSTRELYWSLGKIIGQWSRERERLEVSPVAKALLSTANNLSEISRLLSGLETGIRSDLEIAVASRVTNLLSADPTIGTQQARELLRSFCAEANRIAHACSIAAADLPQTPGERGRSAHKWYDQFTALLLQIAAKAKIKPTLRKDRITKVRSGWLFEAACAFKSGAPRHGRHQILLRRE